MTYAERLRAEADAKAREQAEARAREREQAELEARERERAEIDAARARIVGAVRARAAATKNPPRDGEGDHAKHGGGDSPPTARPLENPLRQPDGLPPPRAGDAETLSLMRKWLDANWDAVAALARADMPLHRPADGSPAPAGEERPARPPVCVAPGDRWTKWKMAEFLRQLAVTQSVKAAANAVGMGRQSAYKLRNRLKGQPFDIAWEAAFRHGYDNLAQSALELALEGEEVPHYYQGEVVGTHRKRNPALIVQLLRMRNREGAPMLGRYGAAAEFWSEDWDRMVQRVETGSVTWSDEHAAIGPEERARLELPDEDKRVAQIIARNAPDTPGKRGSAA